MNVPDDLTVTTATRTEAEVRTALGQPEPATPAAAVSDEKTPKPAGQADASDDAGDLQDPVDPAASEAARTLRANRLSERKTRMQADIALYEDNVRRMGGTVKAFETRTYTKPQDELDHLARRRHELLDQTNKLLREGRAPTAPAAAPQSRPAAASQPPASASTRPAGLPAPPTQDPFTFPTFEQWQEKHPEKDFVEYTDARSDARDAWKDAGRRVEQQYRDATVRAQRIQDARDQAQHEFATASETFRAEHADYDQVLERTNYPREAHPKAVALINELVLRAAKHAPNILYFLGQNADEVNRLFLSPNEGELLQTFGEIKYAALKASGMSSTAAAAAAAAPAASAAAPPASAAAAAAAPSRPATSAPAPLTDVRAGAQDTRTLAQVAADTEDADEYIAKRKEQQRRAAGRA